MSTNAPNVLTILGVTRKEDVISNLLRYCIEASPSFRDVFLRNICAIDPSEVTAARAFTRISTDSSGVPDLIIAVDGTAQKRLVILENKLMADEGIDQTVHYSSPECVRDLKIRVGWSEALVAESFVFLTLFPDQEPEAAKFRRAMYADLLRATRGLKALEDPLAQLLLDAWTSLLLDFYSNGSILPEESLLAKLQEVDPLEGNYLYFKSFVQGLSLGHGLEVESAFRSSARGRRYFGAVISKPSWHPCEMEEVDGTYQLNAKQNFNIHFEPQFHYLKGVLELYLHYEVNPYETADWVAGHIPPTQYNAYAKVRALFVEALGLKGIPNLLLGGGTNQIAKARLSLEGTTVAEARNAIADIINRVAVHIDEIRDNPTGVFAG